MLIFDSYLVIICSCHLKKSEFRMGLKFGKKIQLQNKKSSM